MSTSTLSSARCSSLQSFRSRPFDPGVIRRGPAGARRVDDDPREPRDPKEPEDPRDPREPPRPPGEPEVTAAERQKIRALVGSLAQPLATCPGAARLASFRQALARLATFPAARLESEMFGVLDTAITASMRGSRLLRHVVWPRCVRQLHSARSSADGAASRMCGVPTRPTHSSEPS